MKTPNFLSYKNDSLIFNIPDATFILYVPDNYFNNEVKVPIAEIDGKYVSMIGICNWRIVRDNGTATPLKPFTLPTMFLCKPYEIEKVKDLSLDNTEPSDYRLLKFRKGDEVISQTKVPQFIDNVEMEFKMSVLTGKIPTTIRYDELWKLYFESAKLNGFSYNASIQLFGILISGICRDSNDLSKMFKETDMKDMNKYTPVNVTRVAKYISPYTAITSENWDEALRAAVLMKDKEITQSSPLEKVVTR